MTEYELQEQMMALVRAFGLHKPDETPCGEPVPVTEAYALTELARGGQLSQNELVLRLNLAKSTVSRMVNKLIKSGWVVRERSPDDGRVWLLQLTEKGREAAANLDHARQVKFAQVLTHIPAELQADVLQSLHVLIEAMRQTNGA